MSEEMNSMRVWKQLKMLLVLPVIATPLLSLAFYGLGGGKGSKKPTVSDAGAKGYNMRLPGARFDSKKETRMDKMAFYEKADQDSARIRDAMNEDPYHTHSQLSKRSAEDTLKGMRGLSAKQRNAIPSINPLPGDQDTAADAVLQKLNQLKTIIHQQPPAFPNGNTSLSGQNQDGAAGHSDQLSRLAKMMQSLKVADTGASDPQFDKLSGMLDKIIRIQHPGSDTGRPRPGVNVVTPEALDMRSKTAETAVADLGDGNTSRTEMVAGGGEVFFSIDDDHGSDTGFANMIRAVVQIDQTVVAGGSIVMRLTEDAVIAGINIPRDNLIYGVVSLAGERLNINVNSIRYKDGIYPVSLQVFDQDGLLGIHVPGAITRDVAKSSADDAVSAIGLTTLDQSIGAQAAAAGIQAAKSLASKKIRLVRVSVRAGYKVYLRNMKGNSH